MSRRPTTAVSSPACRLVAGCSWLSSRRPPAAARCWRGWAHTPAMASATSAGSSATRRQPARRCAHSRALADRRPQGWPPRRHASSRTIAWTACTRSCSLSRMSPSSSTPTCRATSSSQRWRCIDRSSCAAPPTAPSPPPLAASRAAAATLPPTRHRNALPPRCATPPRPPPYRRTATPPHRHTATAPRRHLAIRLEPLPLRRCCCVG